MQFYPQFVEIPGEIRVNPEKFGLTAKDIFEVEKVNHFAKTKVTQPIILNLNDEQKKRYEEVFKIMLEFPFVPEKKQKLEQSIDLKFLETEKIKAAQYTIEKHLERLREIAKDLKNTCQIKEKEAIRIQIEEILTEVINRLENSVYPVVLRRDSLYSIVIEYLEKHNFKIELPHAGSNYYRIILA